MRDAELVVLQAGGDVGVRAGVDVRVHAQADRRTPTQRQRLGIEQVELGHALDVEAAHTGVQRLAHLGAGLAHAGEHDPRCITAGGQHACEFAAGDDVESAAGLREGLQHGEAGIGLHRVAHQVRPAAQRLLVGLQRRQHGAPRVHVQRRAVAPRQLVQGVAVQPQHGPAARQERGAGQRHFAAAEAAAGAAAAAGSVSGPFWPQPASTAPLPHASRVVTATAATLDFVAIRMQGF